MAARHGGTLRARIEPSSHCALKHCALKRPPRRCGASPGDNSEHRFVMKRLVLDGREHDGMLVENSSKEGATPTTGARSASTYFYVPPNERLWLGGAADAAATTSASSFVRGASLRPNVQPGRRRAARTRGVWRRCGASLGEDGVVRPAAAQARHRPGDASTPARWRRTERRLTHVGLAERERLPERRSPPADARASTLGSPMRETPRCAPRGLGGGVPPRLQGGSF